jgi:hypothetical protein
MALKKTSVYKEERQMDYLAVLAEALTGGLKNIGQIAMIVIPLMLVIELFQALNLLDKATRFFTPLTKFMGVSREGNLPMFAGLFFGIIYGGGVIIKCAHEGKLNQPEIYRINLFLSICHGLVEEPLLFAAIGASLMPLYFLRIGFALLVTFIFVRLFLSRVFSQEKPEAEGSVQ